ncbi:MAG: anthranilate synthase component I family protein [Crocinitomicaceae bacterium]|nr:anthranilate synthase component I family protein [Crocinitomicaceae bacterium]
MKYQFKTKITQLISDLYTPVEIYMKLRDRYPNSFLLESSEYKSKENSFSYLCFEPIAEFKVDDREIQISYPNSKTDIRETGKVEVAEELSLFLNQFESDDLGMPFTTNGLFGYTSYDAIPLFQPIQFQKTAVEIPLIQYHLFRNLIVFNHFNNELYIVENLLEGEEAQTEIIKTLLQNRSIPQYQFQRTGEENSNVDDEAFMKNVENGIAHCQRGDVFQVVLSRKFRQAFKGDEFNVYRALRSVNPSPYLFYFDYGDFKVFGSSPEAQLVIREEKAEIHPIAGTYRRTGDLEQDQQLAEALLQDEKENAEHVMLVDLARNDLSISGTHVQVEKFKEVEYYSHVIHLVSKVSSKLRKQENPLKILGETYPAGTLSGAPKHRAMQIIDGLENENRNLYGGAIGFMDFKGNINHAIFIRSFLSKGNVLTSQAGAGVVINSQPESELNEVNNKLAALKKAIEIAERI